MPIRPRTTQTEERTTEMMMEENASLTSHGNGSKLKSTAITMRSLVAFALTVVLSFYIGFSFRCSSKNITPHSEASNYNIFDLMDVHPVIIDSKDGKNKDADSVDPDPCSSTMIPKPVPTFKGRAHLGRILEEEKMSIGVELGVQQGLFAENILNHWTSCTYYLLVDIWAHQENYHDVANVPQKRQDAFYETTLSNTEKFKDKRHICRNFTSVCVEEIEDGYFDFIYVDARHDFKGVYEDLVAWWPKLRVGGIMAGHDYVTQGDGPAQSNQDWTTNYDGTKDETGTVVKGAVDKFSVEVCRQLTIGYREPSWNSWAMRK